MMLCIGIGLADEALLVKSLSDIIFTLQKYGLSEY